METHSLSLSMIYDIDVILDKSSSNLLLKVPFAASSTSDPVLSAEELNLR